MKKLEIDTTEDQFAELPKITRVEVIDRDGRAYSALEAQNVALSIQDEGLTLKVFLT